MNVALPKPGFGKLPDRPSFDKKTLAAKTKSGTTATASQSTLKASVSQNISTATRTSVFKDKAASSRASTPFVAATHNMGVNDFTRDRTVSVPHGYYAAQGGKFQLESDMGMTGRSTQRLLQNYEKQQMQQMAYLQNMNAMYGNNYGVQQQSMNIADIGNMLMSAFTMVKESGLFGSEKGGKGAATAKTVPSSNENIAAMQNATTSADLSTAIDGAKKKAGDIGTTVSNTKGEVNTLKGKTKGLETASKAAAQALIDNKTAISQKKGEVQNNIQRERASNMAMTAAKSQVDMLKSQLASAGPLAKAAIETSLRQAEEQLKLKTEQYETAVADREQSEKDLSSLEGQTADLESKATTAESELKTHNQTISKKESEVIQLEKQQKEIDNAVGQQETRLNELKEKEDKDKKA